MLYPNVYIYRQAPHGIRCVLRSSIWIAIWVTAFNVTSLCQSSRGSYRLNDTLTHRRSLFSLFQPLFLLFTRMLCLCLCVSMCAIFNEHVLPYSLVVFHQFCPFFYFLSIWCYTYLRFTCNNWCLPVSKCTLSFS